MGKDVTVVTAIDIYEPGKGPGGTAPKVAGLEPADPIGIDFVVGGELVCSVRNDETSLWDSALDPLWEALGICIDGGMGEVFKHVGDTHEDSSEVEDR